MDFRHPQSTTTKEENARSKVDPEKELVLMNVVNAKLIQHYCNQNKRLKEEVKRLGEKEERWRGKYEEEKRRRKAAEREYEEAAEKEYEEKQRRERAAAEKVKKEQEARGGSFKKEA